MTTRAIPIDIVALGVLVHYTSTPLQPAVVRHALPVCVCAAFLEGPVPTTSAVACYEAGLPESTFVETLIPTVKPLFSFGEHREKVAEIPEQVTDNKGGETPKVSDVVRNLKAHKSDFGAT